MERVIALTHTNSRARRRRARTAFGFGAVFIAISTALLAFTPAASPQEVPGVAAVRDRLSRAQADAADAQGRYDQAVADRDQAQAQLKDLEQAIPTTRAQEAALRTEIANRAVVLYKNSADASGLGILESDNPMDAGRKTKFTEAADKYYGQRLQEIHDTADRQQHEQADLQSKRNDLDEAVPRLEQEKADADQKVAKATRGVECRGQGRATARGGGSHHGPIRAHCG